MIGSARPLGRIPRVSTAPLLGPAEIRQMAARAGIQPTKTLGQNFVIDANTIRRIVTTARVDAGEVVLEVGPGLGSLTLGLLDAVEHVVAVEIDPPLAAQLPHTVARFRPEAADRLEVVAGDVRSDVLDHRERGEYHGGVFAACGVGAVLRTACQAGS